MEFLRLFGWGVWVVTLGIVLWRLIVIDFDEKGDRDTLKLCSLALLVNAVFFKIQNVTHKRQFLLQLWVMRDILSISIEPN